MSLYSDEAQWRGLGASFGLTPYRPTASYADGACFRQLKRALGVPAVAHPPSFDDWHYGRWNGVEVLLLNHTTQAGSSSYTSTIAVARIDPPLFLGVNITAKPTLELFAPQPVLVTGNHYVDQTLRISATDHARMVRFLALDTQDGIAFMHHVGAHIDKLHIGDSRCAYSLPGNELDPNAVRRALDLAVHSATTLGQRRRAFGYSPAEEAQREEWRRFANDMGFTCDPDRMTMFGQHEGAHLKIALEMNAEELRTSVNVRFPRPVHVAFSVLRTLLPGVLQSLIGQDIKVGDEVFDEQYHVTGWPVELVREAIAKPALVDALKRLGSVTDEVHLNHAQLFFRVRDPLANANALAMICETGRVASTSLFAQVENLNSGPYR